MIVQKIYIGGWFQRTTLHLSEIADFLIFKKTNLQADTRTRESLLNNLQLKSVVRKNWLLEFIQCETDLDIGLRIYEDGLIILEIEHKGRLPGEMERLANYYNQSLSPVIKFLFSRGAPLPKELAQIKTILPYVITAKNGSKEEAQELIKSLNQEFYAITESPYVQVYKSEEVIVINSALTEGKLRQLVEGQIFFREFKSQLHRYLDLHRLIWEEIAQIKERGSIGGKEIPDLRAKLSDYQKTVQLIDSRIAQMGTYLDSRAKIANSEEVDKFLDRTFEFKYETLKDTLNYIQDLWEMTANYLETAVDLFREIQTESTKTSISSLQLITTLGVVAGIVGYLGRDNFPNVTIEGLAFFAFLILATWGLNRLVGEYFRRKKYTLKKEKSTRFRS